MRLFARPIISTFIVACLFGTAWFSVTAKGRGQPLRARAIIRGGPDSSIMGEVILTQRPCSGCPTPGVAAPATDPGFKNFPEPTVNIVARIYGSSSDLTAGAHGMHIHETGKCDPPGFTTANSHFDPGPFSSAGSQVDANHPFHMGDIPNLIVNTNGEGFLRHRTSRITLSPGPLSVFDADGSAIIVHLNPDRGITGTAGASGGSRIACGVIEMLSDAE